MHVVIGGFGRVGRHLAHMLEADGHDVAVIDREPRVFSEYGQEIAGRKLVGEVFDRDTLLKAGIERTDAFAAVTAGDNSNIVAARLARERFGIKTVVARIYDPRRAAIYEQFGVPTISSVSWAGSQLVAMITEPSLRVESVYGGGEVLGVVAEAPGSMSARRVGDIEYPGKFTINAIVRNGTSVLPNGRTELVKGDRLHIAVVRESLDELKDLLGLGGS